jgi:DNA-binding HxlR family transcriptional regulator
MAESDRLPPAASNPVAFTLETIGQRRRVMTLWALFWGARSASEIVRRVPDTDRFELHRELEELAQRGLVAATPRAWGNGRLEYRLTPLGESLRPLLGAIYSWGLRRLG